MTCREPAFVLLGAPRRLPHALHCLPRGATLVVDCGVAAGPLMEVLPADEDMTARVTSLETGSLIILEVTGEIFSSPSWSGTQRHPRLLSLLFPGTPKALLVCGVWRQGRAARVFMVMTQRVAEVYRSSSILPPDKVAGVVPDDGHPFSVSVMTLLFSSMPKEALCWSNEKYAEQTHVCTATPSTELWCSAVYVQPSAFLGLPGPECIVASVAKAARRRNARSGMVLEARVASFEAVAPEYCDQSLQRMPPRTMAGHSTTWRWRPFLFMALAAGPLLIIYLIWDNNGSRAIVKWFVSHLRQCWGLVVTTASTVWRVLASRLHRHCLYLLPLARDALQCPARLLQADLLLVALALACCSLLHLALSAVLMGVRPVRHALRHLENQLVACPRPVLAVATLLWRCFVTVVIIFIFAAVAARAW